MPPAILTRYNERSARPAVRINFINEPLDDLEPREALRRLELAAAIIAPLLIEFDLSVNRLSAHAYNPELWGRKYEKGEHIMLVLRNETGTWLNMTTILYILTHKLAHNRYMSHGPMFAKLEGRIRKSLRDRLDAGWVAGGLRGRGRELGSGVVISRDEDLVQELARPGFAVPRSAQGKKSKGPAKHFTGKGHLLGDP
ncbi:hypothetical protein JCM10212_006754 [Sporobolomyces blumeae]